MITIVVICETEKDTSFTTIRELLNQEAIARELTLSVIHYPTSRIPQNLENVEGVIICDGPDLDTRLKSVAFCREYRIPLLAFGSGMRMALVDFTRAVAGVAGVDDTGSDLFYSVIMPNSQSEVTIVEDSMFLGMLSENSNLRVMTDYESVFNSAYQGPILEAGLKMSGFSQEEQYLEVIEWPNHPFYLGIRSPVINIHSDWLPIIQAFLASCTSGKEQ